MTAQGQTCSGSMSVHVSRYLHDDKFEEKKTENIF